MKTKLNYQIYIGFSFALFLVFAVGASSYFGLERQSEDAKWVTHTYKVQSHADRVLKTLIDMETGRRGYRATKQESFLEPYKKGLTDLPPLINELKAAVVDSTNKRTIPELENAIDSALQFWRSLDDGVVNTSEALTNTTIEKQKVDKVRAVVNKIFERQKVLLEHRSNDSEQALADARAILLFGTFVILIVVIALMFFILKEFRNRKIAEQEAKDNYKKVVQLNAESDKHNWMLRGVGVVNDSLQGSNSLQQLCTSLTDSIIKYTGNVAGAIYVLSNDKQTLVLEATSGVNKPGKREYKINESPAGLASKGKDIVISNNIPIDYANIESAIVKGQPAQATYIPLWMGDDLKGVIEIFSWSSFTDEQLNLFRSIGNNIAIAINAAQARAEAKALLEEVQHQKEILESQQEELRQTNEELSKQAEELQASEEELRVQEEELRQINAELEEKNEAVVTSMRALDIKAKELEQTSRYKSEFLANMSHELRTPLNSILILAKLLSDNQPKNLSPKQIEYASIIHKAGNDLLQLINDILDLSKIEAGKVILEIEETSISDIATDVSLTFQALAQQKKVDFQTNIDPSLPATLQTDKQRLEQVIKNLLSNAFKFTPEDGKVTLDFKKESDNLIGISVKDTGIGISSEKQHLIFEAFQQADGSTSRKYGGTGLGLSISRELMQLLGGKIDLQSQLGKGSEFRLILPMRKGESLSSAPVSSNEIIAEKISKQSKVKDDRKEMKQGVKSMLIVEDDETFATILRDYAKSKGYQTIVAMAGDEGLHYAFEYKPSAIILDMQLPEMDGGSLLQKLKADKRTKNIPVHIISASINKSMVPSEAIAWLEKPVSEADLEKAFSKIQEVLHANLKKILLYSNDASMVDEVRHLLQHNENIDIDYVNSLKDIRTKCDEIDCDCIIIDMGKDVEKELKNIHAIKQSLGSSTIPFIICIDKDISASIEMELKKLSDVVIRTSSSSNQRLLEELDLFLYKVQETGNGRLKELASGETHLNELAGKKILLADDDMRNVFSLNAALEMHDMTVVTASDGKEAVDILKQEKDIDLVLMDIMMPEMDGYEAIKYIRKEMNLKKLPIIALTAKAMSDDREKAIRAGASDYITKPVDLPKLLSLMRVWISQ